MPVMRYIVLSLALFIILTSTGCIGGKADTSSSNLTSAECPEAYTYAPSVYTINIVAGDAVVLDPASQDFPLYCDPTKAQAALDKEIAESRLPQGNWRIYRVWGVWDEITTKSSTGVYLLNQPAPLVDWVI